MLSLSVALVLSSGASALPIPTDTTTSGYVIALPAGAWAAGTNMGLVRKTVVDGTPVGTSIVPDMISMVMPGGQYTFQVDSTDPTYSEFYVFSLSSVRFNEIFDDVASSLARPYPEDCQKPGVVALDGRMDNPGVDFELESNKITETDSTSTSGGRASSSTEATASGSASPRATPRAGRQTRTPASRSDSTRVCCEPGTRCTAAERRCPGGSCRS